MFSRLFPVPTKDPPSDDAPQSPSPFLLGAACCRRVSNDPPRQRRRPLRSCSLQSSGCGLGDRRGEPGRGGAERRHRRRERAASRGGGGRRDGRKRRQQRKQLPLRGLDLGSEPERRGLADPRERPRDGLEGPGEPPVPGREAAGRSGGRGEGHVSLSFFFFFGGAKGLARRPARGLAPCEPQQARRLAEGCQRPPRVRDGAEGAVVGEDSRAAEEAERERTRGFLPPPPPPPVCPLSLFFPSKDRLRSPDDGGRPGP